MLDRIRFNTEDSKALAHDLDRLVNAVRSELAAIDTRAVRRFRPRSGPAASSSFRAAFDEISRVSTALATVTVTLPEATAADAGRSVLLDRLDAANTLTVRCTGSQLVNGVASLTLPAAIGAYPLLWTGSAWRTTEGR